MRRAGLPFATALLLAAPAAWPCGTCAEDKVAATYDHALLQRAASQGRVMVFCEVAGAWDRAALQAAARRTRGIDPDSLRFSREQSAMSFALDTRRQSAQGAALAIQQAAAAGTRVRVVQVMGTPAPATQRSR
ncbi:hypothetical protein PE066_08860 [Ramlibacter tataouinensis]|uniref:hypothetical protein n=1 Tax=Ramlibacter tataouinensis TaxID=94132 RepID=UPI0022F3AB5B|nr:hypothetical protein [Ramlibacter tataouinensis]WBY03625.1 hypothetical protein PE066_08860 [Ramlibacter tataouinensis]